ncbi:MAG: trans-aconitate 2-methyltransferase [Reyranellaceae bacterium]
MEHQSLTDSQSRLGDLYTQLSAWMDAVQWYDDGRVFSVIESLIRGVPSRILELGCGTGKLLSELSTAFPTADIVGVDISAGMVAAARQRNLAKSNVQVLRGDWTYDLRDEARGFDVVIIKNVLHLLNDPKRRLHQLGRIVSPLSTLVVVETVSPTLETNALIRRIFRSVADGDLKKSFFTDRSLRKVMRDSGWKLDVQRPFYIRQHIDVSEWLSRKCSTNEAMAAAAEELRRASFHSHVRDAMEFDTAPGTVPKHMLRLQFVGRYYRPTLAQHTVTGRPIRHPVQLELI